MITTPLGLGIDSKVEKPLIDDKLGWLATIAVTEQNLNFAA
jgi:hypothetical protein